MNYFYDLNRYVNTSYRFEHEDDAWGLMGPCVTFTGWECEYPSVVNIKSKYRSYYFNSFDVSAIYGELRALYATTIDAIRDLNIPKKDRSILKLLLFPAEVDKDRSDYINQLYDAEQKLINRQKTLFNHREAVSTEIYESIQESALTELNDDISKFFELRNGIIAAIRPYNWKIDDKQAIYLRKR